MVVCLALFLRLIRLLGLLARFRAAFARAIAVLRAGFAGLFLKRFQFLQRDNFFPFHHMECVFNQNRYSIHQRMHVNHFAFAVRCADALVTLG